MSTSRNLHPAHAPIVDRAPAEMVRMLAEHLGVDLDTLQILNDRLPAVTWAQTRVAEEREALEECLDRGEPMPPAVDNRGRTIRRWLLSRESVRT